MHKIGRNDPCPCGSGKKHKKCCEQQTKSKGFHAEVVSSTRSEHSHGLNKVSSLFFKNASPSPTKSIEPIKASIKSTEGS